MRTLAVLAWCIAAAAPVLAHQPDIPKDIPEAYLAECGSCHVAYLPALLGAADWREIMNHLDKHYGDDATISAQAKAVIEAFLVEHAEPHWKAHFPSGDPPRLTNTLWYRAHHLV